MIVSLILADSPFSAPRRLNISTSASSPALDSDRHVRLDPAFLSEDDDVRGPKRFRGPSFDGRHHVLGGGKTLFRIERHRLRHGVGELLRNAGLQIAGRLEELLPSLLEFPHRRLWVLRGQKEEEDRSGAVQVARGGRLALVLLWDPPARRVYDLPAAG